MASEWEPFKNEIILLYLVEGLTLNEVSSKMIQRHGFDKKKHQYEYMLKNWKISKNTKSKVWEYVDHKLKKRQNQQKESQVRLNGIVLSDLRVRKATQKYGRRSLAAKFLEAPSPESPVNTLLEIFSPPGPLSQSNWPDKLPWAQFDTRLLDPVQLPEPLIESIIRALATCNIDLVSRPQYETDLAVLTVLSRRLNWKAVVDATLPQLADSTQESAVSTRSNPRCITAVKVFQILLFQLSNKKVNVNHPMLARNMLNLIHGLCREAPAAIDHLLSSTDSTAAAIRETFFAIIVRFGQPWLISKFLAVRMDPNILVDHDAYSKTTLSRGKAYFQRYNHIRQATPLQLACEACDIETARVLLDYKARPDFGNPTPLQILCSAKPSPEGLILAKLLLKHGVRPNINRHHTWLTPLMEAVSRGNTEMVRLLLQHGATTQTVVHCNNKGFTFDTFYPSHLRFEFPKYGYLYTQHCDGRLNLYKSAMDVSALQIAIIVNNPDIIKLLLCATRGSEDEEDVYRRGLITACLTSDTGLVRRLLDLSNNLRHDNEWINAAFCATAWSLDCRIAHLLLEDGLIPQWQDGFCISAGQVAALHGNEKLLKVLHTCGYDINASTRSLFSHESREDWERNSLEHPEPDAWLPLECAIRVRHLQTAHTLLQLGATITNRALTLAFIFGDDELVLNLLARGTFFFEQHSKLIQIAIQEGKGLAVIRKLVDAGAPLIGDELVTAVKRNAGDIFEYLQLRGLDIFAHNAEGETVLDAAAQVGSLNMIHIYFICGGHYNSKALLWAVIKATTTSDNLPVEFLIEKRPAGPMDAYETTGFVQSILANQPVLVRLFLDLGASTGTSYFCWHDRSKQVKVQESLKSRWKVLKSMRTCHRFACYSKISPLWAAAHKHCEALLQDLINRNFHPDALLLKSALYNSNFGNKKIRDQLAAAYPISSITNKGVCRRLLVEAILSRAESKFIREHINSVDYLDFGSYDSSTWYHGTPLQFAAGTGNVAWARALLEAGADVNAPVPGETGRTALQSAVEQFDYKMVTLLLDHGANVDGSPCRRTGFTAIELAAMGGHIDIAALLLPQGTLHGHLRIHLVKAVHLAELGCHHAMVELLKKHGGWAAEDSELAKTRRVLDKDHTCPRVLYADESWDGECENCDEQTNSEISSTSSSFSGDHDSVVSVPHMIETDKPSSTGIRPDSPGHDLTMLTYPMGSMEFDAMGVAETFFEPFDSTTAWLGSVAGDHVDSVFQFLEPS